MLFLSNSPVYRMNVEPTDFEYGVGGRRKVIRGKAVQFKGPRGGIGQWDSLKAQKDFGWTDEERKEVEQVLLDSEEFTHAPSDAPGTKPSIYLAPDQDIEDLDVPEAVAAPQEFKRCSAFKKGTVDQCKAKPLPGTDKCRAHTPKTEDTSLGELEGAVV